MDNLWKAYKSNKDIQSRDELIGHYLPLVRYIAGRLAIHLPDNFDRNDLLSYGAFGLLDAIEKYDPDRDVKFETYASTRIRGSMLDGLRSADWIPRSVRAKARRIDQTLRSLENQLGRTPTDHEMATSLEVPLAKYYSMLDEVRHTSLLSLDEVMNSDSEDEPLRLLDTLQDETALVDDGMIQQELQVALAEAVDVLPERERLVVALYYNENLTLKEIGHVLGVSESRVCQLHTKAILSLRSKLDWL